MSSRLQRTAASLFRLGARSLDRTIDVLGDGKRFANFMRGRLEFRPRDDDIYVVTYPRSGTTWMQYMLYLLTTDGDLDFRHINEVTPWFERALAIGFQTAGDFERIPSPRIFKSHLPWGWLPRRGRYVYVWRNGDDVAVSYYHFYRSQLGFEGDFDGFFDLFMAGRLQYGAWARHVASWRAHGSDPNVMVVSYEALSRGPRACLREVADFCGIEVTEPRLTDVLQRSEFKAMKAIESKFDHATAILLERGMTPKSFLRAGKTGAGHEALSDAQRAAIDDAMARPHPARTLNLRAFLR